MFLDASSEIRLLSRLTKAIKMANWETSNRLSCNSKHEIKMIDASFHALSTDT